MHYFMEILQLEQYSVKSYIGSVVPILLTLGFTVIDLTILVTDQQHAQLCIGTETQSSYLLIEQQQQLLAISPQHKEFSLPYYIDLFICPCHAYPNPA